ncbi:hypothetical protein ASC66_01055 [Leifsonia sp. Root4]|nr:hypothetical protein ASC66_01055 [Leifsonia sp. Root4]
MSAEIARQRISKRELAKAAGISPDSLRARLKGHRPFYVDELVALCHALGVPVSVMLDKAGIK